MAVGARSTKISPPPFKDGKKRRIKPLTLPSRRFISGRRRKRKVYVLVSAEIFERIKPLIDEQDLDIKDTYAAQFAAMDTPECWTAPGMELYDDSDAHK